MPDKKYVKKVILRPDDPILLREDDMLVDIVTRQKAFAQRFHALHVGKSEEFLEYPQHGARHGALVNQIKGNLEAIHNEAEEIRDWLPWKHWKKYSEAENAIDLEEMRLEYIDLLHFVVEGLLLLGLGPDEIHRYYVSKSEENIRRQKEEYGSVRTEF